MTPYSEIFNSFMDLIIRDTTFLVKNPDVETELKVSETIMLRLLNHAITNMLLVRDSKDFEINFLQIKDDENMRFNEDFNSLEIDIIAYFMWQCYIEEEVVTRLQALKTLGFSDDEIKSFSPAESMKQFRDSLDKLKSENILKVKQYKRISRKDFKYKRFDYSFE